MDDRTPAGQVRQYTRNADGGSRGRTRIPRGTLRRARSERPCKNVTAVSRPGGSLLELTAEYARALAELEGADFQTEVAARLGSVILGFTSVPAKPQGDAGLDAISHEGQHGYCCYGLEHDAFKSNPKREAAFIDKFASDLAWLCELSRSDSQLVHKENKELARILPKGQKLVHIKLIANWFESHRVIGPLLSKLAEFKKATRGRYIDPKLTISILGPKDLATMYAVDEITIARARQHSFIKRVQSSAERLQLDDPRDFDWKMELLLALRNDQRPAIEKLSSELRLHGVPRSRLTVSLGIRCQHCISHWSETAVPLQRA